MIANTLIFLLGSLVTALAVMILSPLVWRKAQSLARREFEATVPISANEIRAEFDRVRAEAAVTVRRGEVLSAETRTKAARAEADLGRSVIENADLLKRNRRLQQTLEEQDTDLQGTRTILAAREEAYQRLSQQASEIRRDAERTAQELEALGRRFRDLTEIAEERQVELVAAEAKIERLSDRLRLADREDREENAAIEKLTDEIAGLQRTLRQERAASTVHQDKIAALIGQLAERDDELSRMAPDPAPAPAETSAPNPDRPASASASSRPARSRSLWSGPAAAEPIRSGSPRYQAALGRRALPALDPADQADIRERISDVAARVIRMTALAEGPQSPLAPLLDPGAPSQDAASPDGKPTLAERVRLLAEAERKSAS